MAGLATALLAADAPARDGRRNSNRRRGRSRRPASVGSWRGRRIYSLPPRSRRVWIGGSPYFLSGGVYYRPMFVGGRRMYMVAHPF